MGALSAHAARTLIISLPNPLKAMRKLAIKVRDLELSVIRASMALWGTSTRV